MAINNNNMKTNGGVSGACLRLSVSELMSVSARDTFSWSGWAATGKYANVPIILDKKWKQFDNNNNKNNINREKKKKNSSKER